jgi:hypothetical protein
MAVRLSALRTGRDLHSPGRFMVSYLLRAELTPGPCNITILDLIYRLIFYLKHKASETADRVSLSMDLLGPTAYVPPEDGERIQFPKRRVLNKRQDDA